MSAKLSITNLMATLCLLLLVTALSSAEITVLSEKDESITSNLRRRLKTKGYNILTLGGSITDGATIPEKIKNAYPYVIGKPPNKVKNAAVRSIGAGYAAHCLQTLAGKEDTLYDVILLEFSIVGHHGLELLLRRLRARYPDAMMIYIHLYSLETDVIDGSGRTPLATNRRFTDGSYRWGGASYNKHNELYKEVWGLMRRYNGQTYDLPHAGFPMNSAYLFSADWRHLSVEGHKRVAEDVLAMIDDMAQKSGYNTKKPKNGSWGLGDQCHSWILDGEVGLEFRGANKVAVPGYQRNVIHYALQFRGAGSIFVTNENTVTVPVFLSFMTRSTYFPKTQIDINGRTMTIDPTSDSERNVMRTLLVGWAKPGKNEIMIVPMANTKGSSGAILKAFRVTGINLCGACIAYSREGNLVINDNLK